jgi:hypothetical protein
MNRAVDVLNRIESNDPYPVEPDSDLAGDRAQIPELWVDPRHPATQGGSGLPGRYTRTDERRPALLRAVRALARLAGEQCAAVWLLEPDDRKIRLQRLVGMHIDDSNNKKAVQSMLPEELRDPYDHEPGIKRMVTASRSPRRKCKFPDYTSLLKEIDNLPGQGASLLLAWRVCSGSRMASVGRRPG